MDSYGRVFMGSDSNVIQTFSLLPESKAKPQPDYIPKAIREDYAEACAIAHLSPKASATLARRCLQGTIRDFWKTKKTNLGAQISEIRENISPSLLEQIEALRSIGDIGAHMERDVNVIVEIEPGEADLLIGLIETLFEDWYVARHNAEVRALELKALLADKRAQQKAGKRAPQPLPEDDGKDNESDSHSDD